MLLLFHCFTHPNVFCFVFWGVRDVACGFVWRHDALSRGKLFSHWQQMQWTPPNELETLGQGNGKISLREMKLGENIWFTWISSFIWLRSETVGGKLIYLQSGDGVHAKDCRGLWIGICCKHHLHCDLLLLSLLKLFFNLWSVWFSLSQVSRQRSGKRVFWMKCCQCPAYLRLNKKTGRFQFCLI